MVPFDDKSPFVTSGIRVGTPAVTTRGLIEEDMEYIVELIDMVISNHDDDLMISKVKSLVNNMMFSREIFVF
jgi:glycine hydroxymethyltransferase